MSLSLKPTRAALAAVAVACAALFAPAVGSAPRNPTASSLADVVSALREVPRSRLDTEALARAVEALKYAADLDLAAASRAINSALLLDARNSYLHFFNGFIYHLQARQGDTEKTDMAIEGYRQALRLEPGNWIAQEFLGLGLVEQKRYPQAQEAFADVLLVRPDDPVVLGRMLAASYLAADARTACAVADQIQALPEARTADFFRTAVSVYASCAKFDRAEQARAAFEATGASAAQLKDVARRVDQWRAFHRASALETEGSIPAGPARMVQTQGTNIYGTPNRGASGSSSGFGAASPSFGGSSSAGGSSFGGSGGSSGFGGTSSSGGFGSSDSSGGGWGSNNSWGSNNNAAMAAKAGGTRMVLVDVVMVRTEDSVTTSKGVNLLSALSLQFGGANMPAFSRTATSDGYSTTTILTRTVTVPALAYTLNVANANSNLNEVLARPTLAAVEGMRSEFFSGTSLNAAVVSSGSSGSGSAVSIERRYGVRLAVQPQILPDGKVHLAIDAARTFLKPPSANIGFTYKLEISEILANANVVMNLGDTLVLGGLSEKESTTNRDGVPLLQDLPGVQYLFSQQQKTDYQRSVLILITPRPAAYTWLAEDEQASAASRGADGAPASGERSDTTSMAALRARYGDWFKPYPNLASVFHHLNHTSLYREFRSADVSLERWDRMETTRDRLRQALDFLFY